MDPDNPGSWLCRLVSTKQLILPGVDHPRIVSRLDSTEEYDSVKIILVNYIIFLSKRYGTRRVWKGQLVCGIMQSEAIEGPIVLSHFYVHSYIRASIVTTHNSSLFIIPFIRSHLIACPNNEVKRLRKEGAPYLQTAACVIKE